MMTVFDAVNFQAATGASRETMARLEAYASLLVKWQKTVNLVATATLADLWRRHMLDSAQLARLIPANARNLTDLGSGAGFPGLVLAILKNLPTRLVEANARKGAFLREAVRLTLAPALVETTRIEVLSPPFTTRATTGATTRADVITARALAPLDQLLGHAMQLLAPGGICLFPKGRSWEAELAAARQNWSMQVTCHASQTDPDAIILQLEALRHA